jgi:hypothetical protein
MHEVSDGVILTNLVPDPAADDHKTVPVTSSTEASEDDFCMEVHGDEGCVWDYENMSGDIIRPCERALTEPDNWNQVSQVVVATGLGSTQSTSLPGKRTHPIMSQLTNRWNQPNWHRKSCGLGPG